MSASVSVVVAVWNGAWCIERALVSVLEQTRPPAEIIVCDDGSTDGTADLVERRFGERVRVLRLPHRSSPAARREGLQIATGDWLAFLDADDWWDPDKLERQLAFAALHPEVKWIYTDGRYVSEQGVLQLSWLQEYFQPVRELTGDLFPDLLVRCFALMSSVLLARDAYRESGGIDPAIPYSHDYDLWLRVLAKSPGAVMPENLVYYWSHPDAMSKRYDRRYLDDLGILDRVERGEFRDDLATRRTARRRRASHAFDLGMLYLRTGRAVEGRALLRRALDSGPATRRAVALAALLAPDRILPSISRLQWVKRLVVSARAPARRIREDEAT